MALNSLICADVPLRNCSDTHSLCLMHTNTYTHKDITESLGVNEVTRCLTALLFELKWNEWQRNDFKCV